MAGYDQEAEELLDALAGAPSAWDAAMDSQDATLRRRALTDAKIQAMAPVARVEAPPTHPMDEQRVALAPRQPRERGFDFERAIAGLTGRGAGISALDQSRLATQRQASDEAIKAQQMQAASEDRRLKQTELRDSLDPGSELSRNSSAAFTAQMHGLARMLGDSPGARTLMQLAGYAKGANALQVKRLADVAEKLTKTHVDLKSAAAKQALAEEGMDLRRLGLEAAQINAQANREIARDRLEETKLKNKNDREDRLTKMAEKEAEEYGKDMAPLNEAEVLSAEAEELKKKANTGPWKNWFQEKIAKPTGLFVDQDLVKLESKQGEVNAALRKAEAGLSQTVSEVKSLLKTTPEQHMDDEEYIQKQQDRIRQLKLRKEEVKKKHPMTATKLLMSAPVDKVALAQEALADPNASEADKEAARRILNGGR